MALPQIQAYFDVRMRCSDLSRLQLVSLATTNCHYLRVCRASPLSRGKARGVASVRIFGGTAPTPNRYAEAPNAIVIVIHPLSSFDL